MGKSLRYPSTIRVLSVFSPKKNYMRQRRCLELLKDYDFSLQYHPSKANVVEDGIISKFEDANVVIDRKDE